METAVGLQDWYSPLHVSAHIFRSLLNRHFSRNVSPTRRVITVLWTGFLRQGILADPLLACERGRPYILAGQVRTDISLCRVVYYQSCQTSFRILYDR